MSVKLGRSTNILQVPAARIVNVGKALRDVMGTTMLAKPVWYAMLVTSARNLVGVLRRIRGLSVPFMAPTYQRGLIELSD